MAHYAFIDDNNLVTEVIVGIDENKTIDSLTPEQWYADYRGLQCIRTSYNGTVRKNYAGIGYTYDADRDAFIAPKPLEATGLDETTCLWIVPYVEDLSPDGRNKL